MSATATATTWHEFPAPRERLLPYLSTQARRSVESGWPLIRALCFDWPNDPAIWAHPRQYLLGDDLLVAPVTESGATYWAVYLPTGEWVDAWTGASLTGPVVINRSVPVDLIPVYIRATAAAALRPIWESA